MRDYTVNEAIAKIRAWEEKKATEDEIKVGDEVTNKLIESDEKTVTVGINGEIICVMRKTGDVHTWRLEDCTKTGRHFPQIVEVLKQMVVSSDL